jgi:hypothetical protein
MVCPIWSLSLTRPSIAGSRYGRLGTLEIDGRAFPAAFGLPSGPLPCSASRLDLRLAGRTVSAPLPALPPTFLLALLPLLLAFLLALLPLLLAFLLALLPTLLAAFLPALLAAVPAPVPRTVAPAPSPGAPSPAAFTGLVGAASISSAHAFLLYF